MAKECKHKFKPRYTEIYSSVIEELSKTGSVRTSYPWQAGQRSLKEKRYIYDICIKCGKTIKD